MTAPGNRHANIGFDNRVDIDDFAFIAIDYLGVAEPACCTGPLDGGGAPALSISVAEARRRGMLDAAAADVNADGMIDVNDFVAVMSGARPQRVRDAGGGEGKAGEGRGGGG